jgi:23S rRNA (uracil1939-C5)-methyltransferase
MTSMALCRHFGICGGCLYQDIPDDAYRARKRDLVIDALAQNGLGDAEVSEVVAVGPGTRRRASFKAARQDRKTQIGFHAAESHDIVDMQECLVLTPSLFALVGGLRDMMDELLQDGEKAELRVTETPNGSDVAISWKKPLTPSTVAAAARWGARLKLARVTANRELVFEHATPAVEFCGVRVPLPVESFLQPTIQGEALLQVKVVEAAKGTKSIADLFSGCGTFTFPLARSARVHAVENDRAALEALATAARGAGGLKPVTTEARDLFKRPLTAPELERFDLVVLDPPRVGAGAQARELAQSKIRRITYVSCNTASFARDARILTDGGFRMGTVAPIDQFLWSSHIEVVTTFTRT